MDLLARKVHRGGQEIDLLPREFRLLEFLMRHAGQVVTRTMLLENVWDYHFDPQTNVIDVHVSRLRQKIDKGFDQAAAAHGARRRLSPQRRIARDRPPQHQRLPPRRALFRAVRDLGAGAAGLHLFLDRRFRRSPDRGDDRRRDRAASPSNITSTASPASSRSSISASPRRSARRPASTTRSISSPIRCCTRSPAISQTGRRRRRARRGWISFPVDGERRRRVRDRQCARLGVRAAGRLSVCWSGAICATRGCSARASPTRSAGRRC